MKYLLAMLVDEDQLLKDGDAPVSNSSEVLADLLKDWDEEECGEVKFAVLSGPAAEAAFAELPAEVWSP